MGAWTFVLTYQVYFLTDWLQVAPAKVATFMSLSTSAMGLISLGCSCAAGWMSDRIRRRKIFVGVAAVFLAAGLMAAAVATTFEQFLIAVGLGTIGSGVYYAVDVALCVEVLPYRQYAARDMGLLMMATALPQSKRPSSTVDPLRQLLPIVRI